MRKKVKNILTKIFFFAGTINLSICPIILLTQCQKNNLLINNNFKNNKKDDTEYSKKAIDSIVNFSDYNPIYSSRKSPILRGDLGFIGTDSNNKKIILTMYNGLIPWAIDLITEQHIIDFYNNKGIDDINTNYSIKEMIRIPKYAYNKISSSDVIIDIPSKGNALIAVLFGKNDNTNQSLFFVDEMSGEIFNPYKNNDSIGFKKSPIVDVGSNNEYIFLRGKWTVLLIGSGTSDTISSTFKEVKFDNKQISFNHIPKIKVAKNDTDEFVGFISGNMSLQNSVDFMLFVEQSSKKVYITAIQGDKLLPIKIKENNNERNIIFEFNEQISTTKNIKNFDDAKNKLFGYGFTKLESSTTNSSSKIIYTLKTESKNKTYELEYTNDNKAFTLKKTCDIELSSYDVFNTQFDVQNQILYYVSNGGSEKAGYAEFKTSTTDATTQIQSLKSSANTNNIVFVDDFSNKRPTNSNHPFIEFNNNNLECYYSRSYIKSDSPIKNLNLSKYTDPIQSFKNDSLFNDSLPSDFIDTQSIKQLDSFLDVTNDSANVYYSAAANGKANNETGTLSYSYYTNYNKWWNNSQNSDPHILNVIVDGFYVDDKISLSFVNNSSIDNDKYNKILELKKQKTSKGINKKDIIDNFIVDNIIDKNGAKFTITEDLITLTPIGESSLKVDIDLTSKKSLFPKNISDSKLKFSNTFIGFKKLIIDKPKMKENNDENLFTKIIKNNYPSVVSKNDIIASFIDFSEVNKIYDKSVDNWNIEYTFDDYEGTLTINKIIYTIPGATLDNDGYTQIEVLNKPVTYNNFKNIYSAFVLDGHNPIHRPSMIDHHESIVGDLKPSVIWQQYQRLLIENKVTNSFLMTSMNFPLVKSLKDVNVNLLNENTANKDRLLKLELSIKDEAVLNIPHPTKEGSYLKFNEKIKNFFKTKKYPFVIDWKINTSKSGITFKLNELDGVQFIHEETVDRIFINLNKVNNFKNNISINQFINNNYYVNLIRSLFEFPEDIYNINFSAPNVNYVEKVVLVSVSFRNKKSSRENSLSSIKTKDIVISGFGKWNPKLSDLAIIAMVTAIIVFVATIVTISCIISKNRFKSEKDLSKYLKK